MPSARRCRGFIAAGGVVFAMAAFSRKARADDDPWFGHDKALHALVTSELGAWGYAVAGVASDRQDVRAIAGAALGLSAGAGKEIYDSTGHGDASWRDLTWDVIGTATGVAVAWLVDRYIMQRPRVVPVRESGTP